MKVISYGRKGRIETAQIVVVINKISKTLHVWRGSGNTYTDYLGNKYNLPS